MSSIKKLKKSKRSVLLLASFSLTPAAGWTADLQTVNEKPNSAQSETIQIIRLRYARAEELAVTLAEIAPPGVIIVPYSPTNSLIIRLAD